MAFAQDTVESPWFLQESGEAWHNIVSRAVGSEHRAIAAGDAAALSEAAADFFRDAGDFFADLWERFKAWWKRAVIGLRGALLRAEAWADKNRHALMKYEVLYRGLNEAGYDYPDPMKVLGAVFAPVSGSGAEEAHKALARALPGGRYDVESVAALLRGGEARYRASDVPALLEELSSTSNDVRSLDAALGGVRAHADAGRAASGSGDRGAVEFHRAYASAATVVAHQAVQAVYDRAAQAIRILKVALLQIRDDAARRRATDAADREEREEMAEIRAQFKARGKGSKERAERNIELLRNAKTKEERRRALDDVKADLQGW